MSFSGLFLTNAGRIELAKAETGYTFNLTHIALGDGNASGSFTDKQDLTNKVMEIKIGQIRRDGADVIIECEFSGKDAPKAFYMREIGIYANGKLCYYDNAGANAEYINPNEEAVVKQKRMRFILVVSDQTNVTVSIASSLYALVTDVEQLDAQKLDKWNRLSEEDISRIFDFEYEDSEPGYQEIPAQAMSATELLKILN